MKILFYITAWALASAIGVGAAIGTRKEKKGAGVSIQDAPALQEERDGEGAKVRAIIFDAYKDMRKHTPGLDYLTACLSRREVSKDTAIYALERTVERLAGRYDIKPLEGAINALKSL